eukprot:9014382-Karenia_brevis.AAC.1
MASQQSEELKQLITATNAKVEQTSASIERLTQGFAAIQAFDALEDKIANASKAIKAFSHAPPPFEP